MGVGNGGQQRQNQQAPAQQRGGGQAAPQDWGDIKGEVSEIAGVAVERGRHLLDQTFDSAKQQAVGYVDQRKDQVAQSIAELSRSLRDAMKEFDDRPGIGGFVDSAADGLDQLAQSIRARSFNEIFEEAEDLVRRRPGVVAGAGLAVGFLIARFIKSSAEGIREAEEQRRRGGGSRTQAQRGGRARAQASPGSSYAGA